MKRTVCLVGMMVVASGAEAQKVDAELGYEKAVAQIWGQINSTQYAVDWCANHNRGSKSAVKKAYGEWNTRFAALIGDINQRIDAVMNPGGAIPAKEFAQKKADLLKRGAQRYGEGIAAGDVEQARRDCDALPDQFATRAFDLEAKFAEELRVIRARPPGAH